MLSEASLFGLLADAVLVVHVAIAAFVVGGLLVVLIGNLARWRWVNDLRFRLAHLAAIAVIVAESLLGFVCPLTTLEMWLRTRAGTTTYDGGFIEHWFTRLLFFSAPPWVFTMGYSLFGLAVLATWWCFPPRRGRTGESPV